MKFLRFMRRLIVVLIVFILLGGSLYTYFISPKTYSFKQYNYINSTIPSAMNGLKIAYLSDINIDDQNSITRLEDIIDELNNKPFDILLFGGDLYDSTVIETKKVSSLLKSIHAPYGKLAILGEKDLENQLEVTHILNDGGFEVINNEVRPIYYKDTLFSLIAYTKDTQINKLKIPKKGIKICLSHQPDTFNQTKGIVDLQLSGHSYGGTFYLPYVGALHKFDGCQTYNHGQYNEKNSTLIVSNGLSGPATFPYKILAPNQVVFITLKTSKQ